MNFSLSKERKITLLAYLTFSLFFVKGRQKFDNSFQFTKFCLSKYNEISKCETKMALKSFDVCFAVVGANNERFEVFTPFFVFIY